ncbi:MAG: response regulator transcription factor [Clostridiales bacterium]|nr:response regulator transcription factor [Clostridiales bacterium]
MHLLIVEDDVELCNATKQSLEQEGYHVTVCYDGNDALSYSSQYSYDLIILDRLLPGKDGISILSHLRNENNHIPVIMVTALDSLNDRIDGLDSGADDYLAKPFAISELKARIRALLRRPHSLKQKNAISYGDIELNPFSHILYCNEKSIQLSKKEAYLLEYLMLNPTQTLTREQILLRVWGEEAQVDEGSLDTYIYFLRRHLKSLQSKVLVKTVHGLGYHLDFSKS